MYIFGLGMGIYGYYELGAHGFALEMPQGFSFIRIGKKRWRTQFIFH